MTLDQRLLVHSHQSTDASPDKITLSGLKDYMGSNDALGAGHYSNRNDKVEAYNTVSRITLASSMSDEHRLDLRRQAYRDFNRNGAVLERAGIEPPQSPQKEQAATSSQTASKLPEDIQRDLKALLANPHSFLALSGKGIESYENCQHKDLRSAIHADQTFLEKGATYWTLPDDGKRAGLAESWANHLQSSETHNAAGAHTSNRTPIDAIRGAQAQLTEAISGGYDITQRSAQAAFSEVALGVNLALNASQTLAGRGADTLTEQTMLQSPDGHSNQGPVRSKHQ
ncbi:hypothetical protein PRJ39_06680 [Lysobacter enzymogenes]|uniref:hypothetical protein n=1 Tax=Lysobacter enzymogenes TaxID=69 RepID=UPI00374A8C22